MELSYELAQKLGWLAATPARGDLVCFQWDSGALDHIGMVVDPQPDGSLKTVEGNTSPEPGTGQAQGEGDGVYVKLRPRSVCAAFIRVPGDVADPAPAPGFGDWAAWVKAGRKGTRPAVPAQVPAEWWAKLAEEQHGKADAGSPHPPHAPQG